VNLVSDSPAVDGKFTDSNLVNAWGIASAPTPGAAFWVNDNGKGLSTLYFQNGTINSLVVSLANDAPTGLVFHSPANNVNFPITNGSAGAQPQPSIFIFAGEEGVISGWNPAVARTQSFVGVNNSDSVYKGLALGRTSDGREVLFATDFLNGALDTYDSNWNEANFLFSDPSIPSNYHPFGVAQLNGKVYVTYAVKPADSNDEDHCDGCGFVSEFSTDGAFLRRIASGGALNAPWGLVIAPPTFGAFANSLLVGNFGDGTVNAYDLNSLAFLGTLQTSSGDSCVPLVIDGLWGLAPGTGEFSNRVYFTAGPSDEKDGQFGYFSAP